MFEEQQHSPWTWLQQWAINMGWPCIVIAAFWLGKCVQALELRVKKAEEKLDTLTDRHMPQLHRALAEIRGLLMGGR